MKTITVDYDSMDSLLTTLSKLGTESDEYVDTWNMVENCTSCKHILKHKRFNHGDKRIIADGCKLPQKFIVNPDKPIRCEQYSN